MTGQKKTSASTKKKAAAKKKPATRCKTKTTSTTKKPSSTKTTTTKTTAHTAATSTAKKKKPAKKKSASTCAKAKKKTKAKKKPASTTTGAPVGAQSTPPTPATAPPATPEAPAAPVTQTAPITPIVPNVPVVSPVDAKFDFLDTAAPVAGYTADRGAAFDATRGYGWVSAATGAPLSIVGNGRDRGVDPNPLLDTFMSMQLTPGSQGVLTNASWKLVVPNGTYAVTVAAGDPQYTNSLDVINVEGKTLIDFAPTATDTSHTASDVVTVTDGVLNVDANGGSNTKIQYLTVATVEPGAPLVDSTVPANNATGVCLDGAVTAQLHEGVDVHTADADGLRILTPAGAEVGGHYNTDGAYSNVTFVPTEAFAANTRYTIQATSALTNPAGKHYAPHTTTFTTGAKPCQQQGPIDVKFTKSTFDQQTGTPYSTNGPTALALGPDPSHPTQLWAAFGTGNIVVYNLDPATGKATGTPTQVTTFKYQRVISSLLFDPSSTASNIKLWVSNGEFGCDLAATGKPCHDFTGAISTLTGASLASLTKTDIVTGLPRSVGNHMNNGIAFGPDGALYLAQGANNGYGAPDDIWGGRADVPLSAAVLRIDVNGIGGAVPYSVDTSAGYNPNAANAKVTTYATGTRNPFSLVWHSNGKLYAPVNESSNGNTPADPAGGAPALTDLPPFDDYFTQIVEGKYYGHPNPSRGEYRLNAGNPTSGDDGPFEVPQYPVGTQPNSNYREPDLDLGVHRSADGSAEFKSNVFGSSLQGQILVTEYSYGKDIIAIKLDANGKPEAPTVIASGFYNPLPIVVDNTTGRIYVGEYGSDPLGDGGLLTLLTPDV